MVAFTEALETVGLIVEDELADANTARENLYQAKVAEYTASVDRKIPSVSFTDSWPDNETVGIDCVEGN